MSTVRIFEFDNYKKFSLNHIERLPKKGRGQLQKLALFLAVHPTLVSQVFRGDKNLTSEQACRTAEFFGLNEKEFEFYLALVERERAGNLPLKKYWQGRIESLCEENRSVSSRLSPSRQLSQAQKAEFYSSWQYSGIRLATSIPELRSPEVLADRLGLSVKRVREVLEFLLATGLCVQMKDQLTMGVARTHVSADSPLVTRHHLNWRLKALEAHANLRKHELAFTAPLTIAKKDREKVREVILQCIEKINSLIEETDAEELSCLGIDWFDVRASV